MGFHDDDNPETFSTAADSPSEVDLETARVPRWRGKKRPAMRVPATCTSCGAEFMSLKHATRVSENRFCSIACSSAHAVATGKFAGSSNPRWLGGVSSDNMRYRRRQLERHPAQEAARKAVAREVRAGRMARLPCERCGAQKTEGHHDDYSKSLGGALAVSAPPRRRPQRTQKRRA